MMTGALLLVVLAAPCQTPVLRFHDGREVCPDRPAVYAFGLVVYEVDGRAHQVPQGQVDVARSRTDAGGHAPVRGGGFSLLSCDGMDAPREDVQLGFLTERVSTGPLPPPLTRRNRNEEARAELERRRYERLRQNAGWNLVTHPRGTRGHRKYSSLYQGARAKAEAEENPKPRVVRIGRWDDL